MSLRFNNPTPMKLGSSGVLAGIQYRVAGRMVMGMQEGGRTYHWNEFHLLAAGGGSAILVHEQTEWGEQWRIFTLFIPSSPLSAPEARSRRVGQTLDLDGKPARIDLVGESRVYFIEGTPPEGLMVGEISGYFNARAGRSMWVVSWVGDKVEHYRGMDLNRGAVSMAFRWPVGGEWTRDPAGPGPATSPFGWISISALVAMLAVMVFAFGSSCRTSRPAARANRIPAGPASLHPGAEGRFNGILYQIVRHELVEIAQSSQVRERHEFRLSADGDGEGLLIQGWSRADPRWALLEPVYPTPATTALQAAALVQGGGINLDGEPATVTGLLLSTRLESDGDRGQGGDPEVLRYGLTAASSNHVYLVRWGQGPPSFLRGRLLDREAVDRAFAR